MIGDSYLTTHLGRRTTKLESPSEQEWFFELLCVLVSEVGRQLKELNKSFEKTVLIADMPDGSINNKQLAVRNAHTLIDRGADLVKVEVREQGDLGILEELVSHGCVVAAHIGYTPQSSKNRMYGKTIEEAQHLFKLARSSRDCGASILTIERVEQEINKRLCLCRKNSLPVYSIFSGRSPYGGQSLNLWDSVYRPPFQSKLFPPTAKMPATSYPGSYTPQIIDACFSSLLRLTLTQEFPPTPKTKLTPSEVDNINEIDPWQQ